MWTCRKCGHKETEPTIMMSELAAGATAITYRHIDGHCVLLLDEADFWKELDS